MSNVPKPEEQGHRSSQGIIADPIVKLETTGDIILGGNDPLVKLFVDWDGALGVEFKALRTIICQIASALNILNGQLSMLQGKSDEAIESVRALEQTAAAMEGMIQDCEIACQEMRVQVATAIPEVEIQSAGNSSSQLVKEEPRSAELNEDVAEGLKGVMERLEEVERVSREEVHRLALHFDKMEESLQRQQEMIEEDLEQRLTQGDDALSAVRTDVDTLRTVLQETSEKKVSKTELAELQLQIESVLEQQREEEEMLKDTHKNLEKLDGCIDLANESKTRMQEMWRIFRGEAQELREWISRGFNDLRCALRIKMDEPTAVTFIDDLRREVRENAVFLSEATSRVEAGIRHKAEAGDLVRLQDLVDDVTKQNGRLPQLLLGTKCLACDRHVSNAEVTDQGCVDVEQLKQREDLYQEVQQRLSRSPPRTAGSDVLKFVAVHVGSPVRKPGSSGNGVYEARDLNDDAPGTHHLVPLGHGSPKPTRTSTAPSTMTGRIPKPPNEERSYGRDPHLVRVIPRRPKPSSRREAGQGPSPGGQKPGTGQSIKDVLGSLPISRRPPTVEDRRGASVTSFEDRITRTPRVTDSQTSMFRSPSPLGLDDPF